ncbi:3-dehydroquinate synthase [Achromatium sp. WMS2]|nr:3-dehydroquinate synthase [Achromatium sp. WMS2]
MQKIHAILQLDLGTRSYPIYIGQDLLANGDIIRKHLVSSQVLIVTNTTVAPLYLNQIQAALAGLKVHTIILPDGEQHKDITNWHLILDNLLTNRLNRNCTLIALGGGVIGDITGFAAACYQRGVAFIQIPTTLLAQVDASVGGKTAINHALGKNMIGAFHQPKCVIIDTNTLNTLPERELISGVAEVIKYGLIHHRDFFYWLHGNIQKLLAKDPNVLAYVIESSCRSKAKIVSNDEQEAGQRALLNLGHTFGHAIETGTGYGQWLHGEAIAVGICMAANLSHQIGWLSKSELDQITVLMTTAKLPTVPPQGLSATKIKELMAIDKKVLDNKLRLVLLKEIGQAIVTDDFDPIILDRMLHEYTSVNI